MRARHFLAGFRVVVWLGLVSSCVFGQSAQVSGTVTDPAGAVVAEAAVTARNVDTGVAFPTMTNALGVYVVASLPPGRYAFSAEHPGFSKATVGGVVVELGAQLAVNLTLTLGESTQTVEVQATAAMVNASSATIGDVINGKQLLDLPLVGRNAYDFLTTQPGVIGFAGAGGNFYLNGNQGNSINYTMDGINAMNNLLAGSFYLYSNVISVDRAEEMRVVTSPADAEYGRGAGQVQAITRGGTNTFRGSAFEEFRNTDLNANSFFNNANGTDPVTHQPVSGRQILNRNDYGIRFGGPLKKNKTFFNGIYEPYKQHQWNTYTAQVYTQTARDGTFRYYPGVLNGNASAVNPSVDFSGNPVTPAGATGGLQTINVYGVDPNRLGPDPTGIVKKSLALMPLPNNFRAGDGLNVAGYTWNRPIPVNFELYEGRIDHVFNERNRLALTLNEQSYHSINVAQAPPYPSVPWQADPTETTQYSVTFTSILRPTLINEVKVGVFRPRTIVETPFTQTPSIGPVDNRGLLPVIGGVPFVLCYSGSIAGPTSTTCASPGGALANLASGSPVVALTNPVGGNPSNYIAPVYQFGNATSWIHGRHAFKAGVEVRLISDSGYDANGVTPNVVMGANGAVPVTGISAFPGIGQNLTVAQNLLTDLNGSVLVANMTNFSPGGSNPHFLPGETRFREWHQNEMSWYVKDDFKVAPNFTLNLGVRYELYLAPYEGQGKGLAPAGGALSVYGISGGLFNPGALTGSPTIIQNVGPGTAHPDVPLYHTDKNNFAPNVGFAWTLDSDRWKWLTGGKGNTVIRAGYGIGYQRLPIYLTHANSAFEPGLAEGDQELTATNLSNLVLPVRPIALPLTPIPVSGVGSHSTNPVYVYDPNLRTPYVQNYSFTIQRQLNQNTFVSFGFVGSKGTKLARTIDMNEVNVYNNSFLQAFNAVQSGGDSALIDQMFANLPVASAAAGVAAAGNGSNYIRTNSSFFPFLANNNPGGLANAINTTTFGTGVTGGLVSHAGLPLNFFTANPQFNQAFLTGNWGNSTYNSLQIQVRRRFSSGLSVDGSYVWSKALGEDNGDSSTLQGDYRTLRNPGLDKQLLSFHHAGVFKLNAIYDLPVGRGKLLGRNMNRALNTAIGGWEVSGLYNWWTGAPVTITGQNTVNNFSSVSYTPNLVGALPAGSVTKLGGYVTYFNGLTQIPDPSRANLTSVGGLNTRSTLLALAGPGGAPLLVNPAAGQLGNIGLGSVIGPGANQVDLSLTKRFTINERFSFELRGTAQNALNHPQWGAPNLNINSTTFGRISTNTTNYGRLFVLQARLNF
jgi:Carboxypeptidase regulatory-like domain/TonB-dependent Receptor Plug Domain